MKKLIFHVVDNEQRDLNVRLDLALHLSLHGYQSIIFKGSALAGFIRSSHNCIVLGRLSANIPSQKELDSIAKASSSVFYFHDEGGFYNDLTYNQSVSRLHALPFLDHPAIAKVLFWGNHQLQIAKSMISSHQSKLSVTGSARFDMFSSTSIQSTSIQSTSIQSTSILFPISSILIATRGGAIFPSLSHATPLGQRIRTILSLDFKDNDLLERTLFGKWKKYGIDAVCVVDLISEISRTFPHLSVTVRPHPSEDPKPYMMAFEDYSNITVQSEGDIIPLIDKHSLLIGCDCTTGIEAILSDKLYINYRPVESRAHDQYRPRFLDKVGIIAETKDEVVDLIYSLLEDPMAYSKKHMTLSQNLSHLSTVVANLPLENAPVVSFCDSIVSLLEDYCAGNLSPSSLSRLSLISFYVKIFIKDVLRLRPFWRNSVFLRLPFFRLSQIKQKVADFNHHSSVCSVQIHRSSIIVTPTEH